MIVPDASVLAPALAVDGPPGDRARGRLNEDPDLHAPHLVDLEVLSVLRKRVASGDLSRRRAELAIEDFTDLDLRRYPHLHLSMRIWELRHNITVYHAAYVALAEALGAPLVTADARLARATGPRCRIELLRT